MFGGGTPYIAENPAMQIGSVPQQHMPRITVTTADASIQTNTKDSQ